MVLSQRIQSIKPSATIAISNKAMTMKRDGMEVISLAMGEPDFATPDFIKAAGIKAINQNQTKYTPVDGTYELKAAAQQKFMRDNNLSYDQDQILVSSGAKQSIFNMFAAILDPEDEVIIPAPCWVSYPDIAKLFGAKPVIITPTVANRLKITPEQLEQAITPKTKCLVLNSPSNPSGMVYSQQELEALAQVLLANRHITIMTDDIYEHIRWQDEPFHNIVTVCPKLKERTVIVNGVSKAYAMTGWRIGIAAGPKDIIAAMKKMQSQSTSNACSVSQVAAAEALAGDQSCLAPMVRAFKERHDFVMAKLNQMPGVNCLPADGAFYAFPQVEEVIVRLALKDDIELANYLLDKAQVAVVPGSAFAMPGFIRLSYALDLETLEQALAQIAQAIS